jgi:hypothetical protein
MAWPSDRCPMARFRLAVATPFAATPLLVAILFVATATEWPRPRPPSRMATEWPWPPSRNGRGHGCGHGHRMATATEPNGHSSGHSALATATEPLPRPPWEAAGRHDLAGGHRDRCGRGRGEQLGAQPHRRTIARFRHGTAQRHSEHEPRRRPQRRRGRPAHVPKPLSPPHEQPSRTAPKSRVDAPRPPESRYFSIKRTGHNTRKRMAERP